VIRESESYERLREKVKAAYLAVGGSQADFSAFQKHTQAVADKEEDRQGLERFVRADAR